MQTCLNVCALSVGVIMAGTGDATALRFLLRLRARAPVAQPYGSHMAAHMAIGFLFLGGGMQSFGTSPEATAALVCALYPRFPASSADNLYHLQAFRHLYALACEPRGIVARDVDSGEMCNVTVRVTLAEPAATERVLTTPAVIPEVRRIVRLTVESPNHWPVRLDLQRNPRLAQILQRSREVSLRRRVGAGRGGTGSPLLDAFARCFGVSGPDEVSAASLRTAVPSARGRSLVAAVLAGCLCRGREDVLVPHLAIAHLTPAPATALPLDYWQLRLVHAYARWPGRDALLADQLPGLADDFVAGAWSACADATAAVDAAARHLLHAWLASGADWTRAVDECLARHGHAITASSVAQLGRMMALHGPPCASVWRAAVAAATQLRPRSLATQLLSVHAAIAAHCEASRAPPATAIARCLAIQRLWSVLLSDAAVA